MNPRLLPHLIPRYAAILLALPALPVSAPAAAPTPTVIGLWRFNEGSGTLALDSSGLGHAGTLAGENGNVPAWATGQPGFGGALRFANNGTDHAYVLIPGDPALRLGQTSTNAWSITAWAYEDSAGTGDFVASYGRIMVLDDGTAFQLESGASGDGQLYTWSRANPGWQLPWGVGSVVAPLLDQWEHWAVVYDGTNLTVYRNGNQGAAGGVASAPLSAALGYAGYQGAITIGSELGASANRTWNGMLDDVAVFVGALSAAQVQAVMSGDFAPFLGGPASILSQPQSATVQLGDSVNFTVGAYGTAPLHYQWFFNTNALPNATNATLTLADLQPSQAGTYSVVVTNSLGAQTSQTATLQVYHSSLVGLWRFNQGSGTAALDSSGLGNTGALEGENGNVPAWVTGQPGFGGALRFTNNGADHADVTIPASTALKLGLTSTNTWTLCAWAYEDSNGTGDFVASYGRILVLDDGTAFQLESGASGDGQLYTWSRATAAWQVPWGVGSAVTPLLDQWEHWAVVYDGTNLTVYRNANQGPHAGVASTAVTAALGYAQYEGALRIGSELGQAANRTWNGMLDDVAVFSTALSLAQIRAVMNGDFSGFISPPRLAISLGPTGLTLSWPTARATFQLQASPSLAPPLWTNVATNATAQGGALAVTLPVGTGEQFFRLTGP